MTIVFQIEQETKTPNWNGVLVFNTPYLIFDVHRLDRKFKNMHAKKNTKGDAVKKLTSIARITLGLIFLVFGLNGFLNFLPMPTDIPEQMTAVMNGFMATGYFFPMLKGVEVICGAMLLAGAFVPLALIVLAPVILNIFLLHAFVDPSGLPIAIGIGLLEVYLAFFAEPYSSIVKQIFRCPRKETLSK